MIGPGHDGAAAGLFHRRGDFGRVGRDHNRADACGLRPAQHVHNHRLSGDIGERLARQSGRGHAGGDQDEDIGHLWKPAVGHTGCTAAPQTGYLCTAPPSPPRGAPSAMDSFEINKILGAVLGTCLLLLAVHIASGAIFTPAVPAKPGYEIAVKEEQPAAGGATARRKCRLRSSLPAPRPSRASKARESA